MDLYKAKYILSIAGVLLTLYLAYLHYNFAFCLQPDACVIVSTSKYSEIFGISIAFFGTAYFLFALLEYFWKSRKFLLISIIISFIALSIGLYLTYVEIFILRAICLFCEVTKVLIFSILLIDCILYVRASK